MFLSFTVVQPTLVIDGSFCAGNLGLPQIKATHTNTAWPTQTLYEPL